MSNEARHEELRQEIIDAAIEYVRMPFTPDPVENHSYRLSKAVTEYNEHLMFERRIARGDSGSQA